ncbi:MAG: flagellar motor switch protein FliM [Thermodesulfobacteriota bacterium]
MSQLLSQEEVDALLSGLDSGEIESEEEPQATEEKLDLFDWTTQEKDVKGTMPLLGVVNNRFSQKLKSALSTSIRKVIEINQGPLEMIKFKHFKQSLPIPTSLHLFKMDPLRGTGLLVIESHLVFNLVEAFFGGRGTGSTKVEGRDFTPIESKIIEKVVYIALTNLMDAWEDIHPIKTEFIRSESNPMIVNVERPDEYLVAVKFDIELTKPLGSITLCIPYSSFQPIRHKLAGGYQKDEDGHADPFWINDLRGRLKETPLELSVCLGSTQLSIRDFLNLKEGDILVLDKTYKSPLTAHVEGIPKFQGYAGRARNRKVYKIEGAASAAV